MPRSPRIIAPPVCLPREKAGAPRRARARLRRLGLKNDVLRLGAFCALGCLELDLRSLRERLEAVTNDRAVVNKKVLTLVRGGDEAIPLGVVEPLHGSSC